MRRQKPVSPRPSSVLLSAGSRASVAWDKLFSLICVSINRGNGAGGDAPL